MDGTAHDPTATLRLLLGQRACRDYTDAPVEDADLEVMLRAATHAPSAENTQPWVFVVVRNATIRQRIDELTASVWERGGRAHARSAVAPAMFDAVEAFLGGGYGGAPLLVVVAGDGRAGTTTGVLAASVYPAAQNLLLAAAALGYGSAMTTIAAVAPDDLARIVGLPAGVRPFAVVPIGRPAAPLGPPRRRPVSAVAHLDTFGTPYPPVTEAAPAPDAGPPPPPPPAGSARRCPPR